MIYIVADEFWQIGGSLFASEGWRGLFDLNNVNCKQTIAQLFLNILRASTVAPEPEMNSTAPEPESTPESSAEPNTLFPEIMTNQEAFLMYGVFIFALAVFCVVLLVLYIMLKKKLVFVCMIDILYDI